MKRPTRRNAAATASAGFLLITSIVIAACAKKHVSEPRQETVSKEDGYSLSAEKKVNPARSKEPPPPAPYSPPASQALPMFKGIGSGIGGAETGKYAPPAAAGQPGGVHGFDHAAGPLAVLPPTAGEELWIIALEPEPGPPSTGEEETPYPVLRAKRPGTEEEIPLPLQHTDVEASVAAYIASVHVTQKYQNPYSEKIEAIYVFPLPQDAAVSEFVMTVGDRHIRGIIREREEAERIYVEARQQGYVASLLTQERPNIFTQSVANIEPGKAIDVEITYFNPLRYENGEYEFVFPMVVGPRFNPSGSKDGVGAVARGEHGASGQAVEVHYLRPGERSGHDISLAVDVEAGMAIESITSPSHSIVTTTLSPTRSRVELGSGDTIPNKDFVLRYRVAGDSLKSGLLVHRDERGGFFTLMLQPPAELESLARQPMEMIFVLDCSGSMSGIPLTIAKSAIERALERLGPDDTFQIVRFSDQASQLGARPVPATAENVRHGLQYLRDLQSEGGTMMIEGIKAALDFPHDPARFRIVSFVTDGFIGNEAEILGEIHHRLGSARIFSFGIGSSTNRYLLERMALLGRGAVAFVGVNEGAARAVDGFYERIAHPALTDIAIDWGTLGVTDVYPRRIPDLFVGRPVVVTGRFSGTGEATVRVNGHAGGKPQQIVLQVDPDDSSQTHPALASVWARMKIADLEDEATHTDAALLGGRIKNVALEYGLMSAFTAFVAVDSSARTAGDYGVTVVQPVPVPDGVRYDTTVKEEER